MNRKRFYNYTFSLVLLISLGSLSHTTTSFPFVQTEKSFPHQVVQTLKSNIHQELEKAGLDAPHFKPLPLATITVTDNFGSNNYSGGSPIGTDGWQTNWTEGNDDNNSGSGSIRIVTGELLLEGATGAPVRTIEREVDVTGATSATWTFDWRVTNTEFENADYLIAQYSTNGGSNYTELFNEDGIYLENNVSGTEVLNITGLSVNSIILQFEYQGSANNEDIFIDDIQLEYEDNAGGVPSGNLTCSAGATEITGTVFQDFNYDGDYDAGEHLGLDSVIVIAMDSLGNVFQDTTDSNGDYAIIGLTASRTYRIEFTNIPYWASPTFYAGDNGTTVQFVQPGSCANLGIASPDDYCQTNPLMLTPCYDAGTTTGANSGATALVAVDYQLTAKTSYSTLGQTGATWGIAYQRESEYAYTASFLKRNVGLSQGLGHIHIRDMGSTYLGSFNVDGVDGIDMGSVDRSSGPDYQLSTTGGYAVDLDAFGKVGQVGFGDIDIYNGDSLTVVNLNSKRLINIDISNTASLPTNGSAIAANLVHEYPLTFPDACTAGEMRPFGLKYHKGTGYLGVVCDASISKDSNDLMAYVYEFDPENIGAGLTKVIDFPLDYPRELKGDFLTASGTTQEGHWRPWVDTWADLNKHVSVSGTYWEIDQASPILSDIEFADDGSMVLGIMDRVSHQTGSDELIPLATPHGVSPGTLDEMSGGDILKVCLVDGVYVMEGGTGCSVNDQSGATAMFRLDDGPSGAGEFFWEDYFGAVGNSRGHPETSLGALAYKKGTNEVVSVAYDITNFNEPGGIDVFNMTTGGLNNSYLVIPSGDTEFDKASGLGDIELICIPAPIEIGNYVWIDTDGDGIQDAGEPGVDSVLIELYDATGTLIATDTTDSQGQYYFSKDAIDNANWVTANDSLQSNTTYYIVAGGNGQYASDTIILNGTAYELTSSNNAMGGNADFIDSDGTIASGVDADFDGEPYVQLMTGNIGEVNHSIDFGFKPAVEGDYDYGDLPDIANGTTGLNDYETYDSTGGPSHLIITGLFLGDTVDVDSDGLPDALAFGDDNDGADDEDGVIILANLNVSPGGTIRVPISVTNSTTDTAYLEAWIDWNGDGDFDMVTEMVADLKDNEDGVFPAYLDISVPTDALTNSSVGFRVRLSNTDNMTPYGQVNSGEVEDYLLSIDCPQVVCPPVETQLNRE